MKSKFIAILFFLSFALLSAIKIYPVVLNKLQLSDYARNMIKENKFKFHSAQKPAYVPDYETWTDDKISFCILGHSTVIINFYGTYIITDPVIFKRIGPPEFQKNLFGIKRITAFPGKISKLPEISYILISHPHYDHLDLPSIKIILKKQKLNPPVIITSAETKRFFTEINQENIVELDWNKSFDNKSDSIRIQSFRVEHYGFVSDTKRKQNSGFNGYLIEKNNKTIAFFGDTSYKRFRDISGNRLKNSLPVNWKVQTGNFQSIDLAILPIGDYYYSNHLSPREALGITEEINAKKMIPIHYNTFILSPPEKYKNTPDMELKSIAGKNNRKLIFKNYETEKQKFPQIGLSCYID